MVPPEGVMESWQGTGRLCELCQGSVQPWPRRCAALGCPGRSALHSLACISSCWTASEGNWYCLSRGSRKRHNEPNSDEPKSHEPNSHEPKSHEPKSVPPVVAQAQWELADGRPARRPELSCPALFWWWTPRLLLWLAWESSEAVTQKSPSSLLLRKFGKLTAAKIRAMKVPSAVQSHGANLTGLTQSEHPWSALSRSWPAV